jgi:hypothetical protein
MLVVASDVEPKHLKTNKPTQQQLTVVRTVGF